MITTAQKRTLLSLIVLGQALDAMTFCIFFRVAPAYGGPSERNMVILMALTLGGLAGVAAMKVGIGTLTFVTGTWHARYDSGANRSWAMPRHLWWTATRLHRLAFRNIMLVIAAMSGFVGLAFNTVAIGKVLG